MIKFVVLGREVVLNQVAIAEAINCERVTNCYYPYWEDIYSGTGTVGFVWRKVF